MSIYKTLLLFCLLGLFNACAITKSATIIPAQSELVLGEFSTFNYQANVRNLGPLEINVSARDKLSEKQTQGFGLPKRNGAKIYLSDKEKIVFSNPSDQPVKVKAWLTDNVEGMEIQPIQAKKQ